MAPVKRTCAHCGTDFDASPNSEQVCCSRSCAAKRRAVSTRGRFTGGRSKVGKRADLGGIFMRSAWEANYARVLNLRIKEGEIVRWEYEPRIFPFPVKRGNRAYTPDFKVWYPDGHYEWHEVKGYMDDASKIKLRRFALHWPDESAVLKLIDRPIYMALKKEYENTLEGWE